MGTTARWRVSKNPLLSSVLVSLLDIGNNYFDISALLEYIDLFLIHDPYSGTERRLATYKALQDARQAGKIRSVGVSN